MSASPDAIITPHSVGSRRRALVLGARGGIGSAMCLELLAAGWHVRALVRQLPEAAEVATAGPHWIQGDALVLADVVAAARGCELIVHAVNPPGYRRWADWVLPMVDHTIAAALAERALVILPGTLYNYSADARLDLDEETPQCAASDKGRIRVEMEHRLQRASERGARVLILRAGDFFGPGAANSWFSQGLVRAGQPVRRVLVPSAPGVGHQWNYLPDVAKTLMALLARHAELPAFACYHTAGIWDPDGRQMALAVADVVERRTGRRPQLRPFPWWLVRCMTPFNETLRELNKMRYLWRQPIRMSNQRLVATLGQEPATPLAIAVERTLEALACLPQMAAAIPVHTDPNRA